MRRIKTWLPVILLSFIIVLPSFAQRSKKISESIKLNHDGRVMIDSYKGSIDVTTWNRDEVAVEVVIEADENRELVALTEVQIRRTGNTLRIESDYSRAKKEGKKFRLWGSKTMSLPFVHYTIRMPQTADLYVDDYKSDILIESLAADLDLETYKGEVKIHDVTGDLRIETYKGEVTATDLAGSMEAETYKGNITAEFIEFSGNSAFDTYRGDIDLRLPKDAGFDLNADLGSNGDFDTNFKLTNVRIEKNKYRGSIGGGGPNLEVDTNKGRVQLLVSR